MSDARAIAFLCTDWRRAIILQELAGDDVPETLPAAVQEEYETFGARVDEWRERATIYLVPLVDQAAGALSEDDRVTAASELAMWTASAEVDEEVSGWMPPGDEDEPPAAKRSRATEGSGDSGGTTQAKPKPKPGPKRKTKKDKMTVNVGSKFTPTLLSQYVTAAGESGDGRQKRKRTEQSKVSHSKEWNEINSVQIELPSSLPKTIRDHAGMKAATEVENSLRKLQAEDALDELRTLLITSYGLNSDRRRLAGQKATTRALNALKRKWMQIRVAAGKYRRVRTIMVALGMNEDDETFMPLRREDVKAFAMFTGEEQLGDSKKMPSWIWEKINFLGAQGEGKVREYCIEGTLVWISSANSY